MSENYKTIVIDGVTYNLVPAEEPKPEPFDVKCGDEYHGVTDKDLAKVENCGKDKSAMEPRALHEMLSILVGRGR